MGIFKKDTDIAKILGVNADELTEEGADYLFDAAESKRLDELSDRKAFAAELKGYSDADLMVFVPDVYQEDVYKIDYEKLKAKGIKLISFDIDDTLNDSYWNKARGAVPGVKVTVGKDAKELFKNLKEMGFNVALLTNTKDSIAKDVCEYLGADRYIARANKPDTSGFEQLMRDYHVEPSQMAHVGNSMRQDIVGGNRAGVTTCLVRRAGYSLKVVKFFMKGIRLQTKGHLVREKLLERGIWRKHHKDVKGDQYYQLDELPKYQAKGNLEQENVAKNKTFTIEEIQRNIYKNHESKGMKTLRTHLGDDIVFTGMWADASDERELNESELTGGELSGFVFTVGSYVIRETVCLFRDDDRVNYTQRVPAKPNKIAKYRKEHMNRLFGMPESGIREVQVISAKHKGVASDDWTFVCLAASSARWVESIDFIGTVKYAASDPDEREMLFVLRENTGDSFSVSHWYRLSSDGSVKEYSEHPYDPDSFKASWRDSNTNLSKESMNMVIPPIPPEILAQAADWAKKGVVTIVAPNAWKKIKKHFSKDHGSKVKRGAFQECSVEMFGDKACIIVDDDSGEVVMLTSDTIESYRYIKEKYKPAKLKTYYYYDITFKDGRESYVRMSKKYREAMESYT